MNNWKRLKIGSFLRERPGRYAPSDKEVAGLKRLKKIDFTGEMHLGDKASKTDMIVAHPGDLVISGINVAKGAIAIYSGDAPVAATIHYSSYSFDEKQINIEFFKWFIKSPLFEQTLKEQVRGGIKTEIKSKNFLPLEISLPEVKAQAKIVSFFKKIETEMSDLQTEIEAQQSLIKRLRQQILQDAIEGKLTADWRKKNPALIIGENHASKLLEKIKAEKHRLIQQGKLKKEKPLPPITEAEKPFPLPEGWAWCRLGELGLFGRGKSKHRPRNDSKLFENGTYPFIQTGDVSQSKKAEFKISGYDKQYNDFGLAQSKLWPKGTLCITIAANIAETGFLDIDACFPDSVVGFTSLSEDSTPWLVKYYLEAMQTEIIKFAPATAQKNINLDIIGALLFPLPPLPEHRRIVDCANKTMTMIRELEAQVSERKNKSEMLMQSVLRKAFDGK